MGKIWEHTECIALFWNSENHVTGVKIEKKHNLISIVGIAESDHETDSLAIALTEVLNMLETTETHLMIAGYDIPGTVSFDLHLPAMSQADMKHAIQYELPRHVPCDPQDVIFGYRIIPSDTEQATGKHIVRISAMMKKQWNELLTELTGAGIKLDALLSPYLVVDPLLGDEESVPFYTTETYLDFIRSPEYPGRKIVMHDAIPDIKSPEVTDLLTGYIEKLGYPVDSLPDSVRERPADFFHVLLLAAYGVGREFSTDKNSMIKLPKELVPERYRGLKISFFALAGTILLLGFMLTGRFWWDAKERYSKLDRELRIVKTRTADVQRKQVAMQTTAGIIKEIIDADKGNPEIATCLRKISGMLPKTMWLVTFSSRDDIIDISIKYKKTGLSIPDFNKTGIMKMVKNRSQKSLHDGTTTVCVTLQYIPPENRNGKK